MKKSTLRDFTCAIKHTFSEKKKKTLHQFDHQPRSHGSLRLTGIQVEFGNECKKIIFRPGANKNKKTKNQTVYHKTYLISIPRPATSVATRMSLAPALRLDKANSLKENQQKESLTGSELRCTCYVTVYVRLSWRTNETAGRDARQKWCKPFKPGV